MARNVFVYIRFVLCIAVTMTRAQKVDPRKILLSFHICNETLTECPIQDFDCIQNAYERMNVSEIETTVFIHGFNESKESRSVQSILSAYCSRNASVGDVAIALLDWSELARDNLSASRLPAIGRVVASTFDVLNYRGYEVFKWHLIGNAMGAHVAGCIGKYTRRFRFSHITGLDPGGAVFETRDYKGCTIKPKTAFFTDILYTDAGGYGASKKVGTLNIYANTGTAPQPGCCSSEDIHACGHDKAVQWYADAVVNETKFPATECENCFAFLRFGSCQRNARVYLGPRVNKNTRGTYCLPVD